jgi:hypothetical protein
MTGWRQTELCGGGSGQVAVNLAREELVAVDLAGEELVVAALDSGWEGEEEEAVVAGCSRA